MHRLYQIPYQILLYFGLLSLFGWSAQPVCAEDTITALADQYSFTAEQQATLKGNVTLLYQDFKIDSDHAFVDHPNQSAQFNGNIRLETPNLIMTAEQAEADLANSEYRLFPASFQLIDPLNPLPGYGRASELTLIDNHQLFLKNGEYTTCDPDNPDWSILGQNIHLDQASGWGSATHMRLHVQDTPVLYFPYFRFPIDDKRHSGVLYPSIYDLTQPDIGVPLYWNIAPNADWTFTPRQIGGRGTLVENEFRYLSGQPEAANPHAQYGTVSLNHLSTDRSANDENRTQFQWQHNTYWYTDSYNLEAEIDFNYLSDNNYLDDFGNSLIDSSLAYIPKQFTLTHQTSTQQWTGLLERLDTLDENITPDNYPHRRLPEIDWTHYGIALGPSIWSQQVNYVYFEEPNRTVPYGHRFHWINDLSLPKYALWGFFTPSLRLQHTEYWLSAQSNTSDDTYQRTLPTVSVDTGLFFERFFSPDTASSDQPWTHTLEPRVFHTYTPFKSQQDLPNFDATELTFGWEQLFRSNRFSGFDRIGDTHQTTLAVTQRWLTPEQHNRYDLTLGQIFYHTTREVGVDTDIANDASISPLVMTANAYPNQHWRLNQSLTWDSEQNRLDEGYAGLHYRQLVPTAAKQTALSHSPAVFNLGYRYDQDDVIKQSQISFAYPIHPRWTVLAQWDFDLNERETLEQISGFRYENCCWRTHMTYHRRVRTQNDIDTTPSTDMNSSSQYRVMVEFELKGLARLGGQTQTLLSNMIPGYTY